MEQATDAPLKKTALNARHRASGARMVAFGGWDMPVEYSGITAEHMAVRDRVGLFDVSHMGEIEIAGKDALAAVQRISCNDASKLVPGQAHYSGLMTPEGTFVDDLLVYRLADQPLPARRERLAHRRRLRLHCKRNRAGGGRDCRRRQLALRPPGPARAARARGASAADGRGL